MVFDKMEAICQVFKWLHFRIPVQKFQQSGPIGKPNSFWPFKIQTSVQFVKNHSDFEWSGSQIVGVIIARAQPFENCTVWNPMISDFILHHISAFVLQDQIPLLTPQKNDRNMLYVSDYMIEKGVYTPVHPITKNFF